MENQIETKMEYDMKREIMAYLGLAFQGASVMYDRNYEDVMGCYLIINVVIRGPGR